MSEPQIPSIGGTARPKPPSAKGGANTKAPPREPRGFFPFLERKTKAWLSPKPIRRKLTAMTMLACTAGLLLLAAIFLVFDLVSDFVASRNAIAAVAKVAAANSREALSRGETPTAIATLNALMDYPDVADAMIYRGDGRPFARTDREAKAALPDAIDAGTPQGAKFSLSGIRHLEPVMDGAKKLGTLAVATGFGHLWERLRIYGLMTALAFVLASIGARLLLGRLHGMISEPVIALARVADTVAQESNYSLRAEKRNPDEVGHLAEAFNHMLAEIQKRDTEIQQRDDALGRANADLEVNVLARTSQLHKEVLERRQAEDALKDSELRYRNLFENNPMPMFVMDLETLDFVAVNNAAMKHYGYRQEDFRLLSLPMITDAAEPLAVERAFRRDAKSFDAGEWKHRKNNGEVIEVQLTAHAIVFAGKVTKIVLANDVTERNRAERRVEEMHQKLVAASRAAGMAEVATGVLHNVGNVLNSVNVSATMLGDSVRKSKAASVRKVADLLDANKADLPAFFSKDGKGQMLPGYFSTLAQQIEAEQQSRLTEIEQLTNNIAHIKDIVAMQQTYAKVTGVMEDCKPRTLVDEVLRMAGSDLKRCEVKTELNCPKDLPEVSVDRHKVMQILINLVTNARQAMEQTPAPERKLTITAAYDGGGLVNITILDTGCGIAQENLTRVFNHGFTTKETGHGFGLHSAANAAKEIGGRLTGTSDGPGKGAAFTLELPLARPATAEKAA